MSEMLKTGFEKLFGAAARPMVALALVLLVAAFAFGANSLSAQTIPTIAITNVVVGKTVTIETANFPPNKTFTVTMGPFGTRGINGEVVGTIQSAAGGKLTATFNIPAKLIGSYSIAIRAQTADVYPYYAYNWFYNETAGEVVTPAPMLPVPTTIPTIKICSVVKDKSVTFVGSDFPPNQTFTVTMGPFGTQGIGGTVVGTLKSGSGGQLEGAGGAVSGTYNIPANLVGSYRIAIRASTAHWNPYVAYNWFYNTTANVCP